MKDGRVTSDNAPGAAGSHGARVPFAISVREPTHPIVKGLPAFYHQACIRTTVRVSTVNPAYSSVWFRFVNASQKGWIWGS